jgi:hypothetical protein
LPRDPGVEGGVELGVEAQADVRADARLRPAALSFFGTGYCIAPFYLVPDKNIMSVAEHNPSRRALLGAAVALPFVGGIPAKAGIHLADARGSWIPDQVRDDGKRGREDGKWERAWRAFAAAEAALRACERRTAGAPWAQQDAVEEEYGACLDALYAALRRLLRIPAPDLAALAAKIELVIDHEVATLTGGEACLAALRRDARRLCSGQTQDA